MTQLKVSRERVGKWVLAGLCLVVTAPAAVNTQQPAASADVMVVAVDRNDSVLAGGISTGNLRPNTEVGVEPLAWLSPSGKWRSIRCDEDHPVACHAFERDYLKKPHTYEVISADGRGATVKVDQMALYECFGYGGQGTYTGPSITYAAVAASTTSIFTVGAPAKRLADADAEPIRKAFAAAVGNKLDSAKELRVYALRLENHDFIAVQRAYQDYGSTSDGKLQFNFIFALGQMNGDRFHLLTWKNEVDNDENEQILGVIHLKSGRDFLVNTVSHPEGQYFRIYGIQDGKLTLVYWGGGDNC